MYNRRDLLMFKIMKKIDTNFYKKIIIFTTNDKFNDRVNRFFLICDLIHS